MSSNWSCYYSKALLLLRHHRQYITPRLRAIQHYSTPASTTATASQTSTTTTTQTQSSPSSSSQTKTRIPLSVPKTKHKKPTSKISKPAATDPNSNICAAYCVNTSFSIPPLHTFLQKSQQQQTQKQQPAPSTAVHDPIHDKNVNQLGYIKKVETFAEDDALHIILDNPPYPSTIREKDGKRAHNNTSHHNSTGGQAFFFASGAAVFWGMDMKVRRTMLNIALKFLMDGNDTNEIDNDYKVYTNNDSVIHNIMADDKNQYYSSMIMPLGDFDHEFRFHIDHSRKKSGIRNDELLVRDFDNPLDLLSLSYGLSQSVKLTVYEEALDRLVEETKRLPKELANHGKIEMNPNDIKKLIGELITARYSVNLLSDILDVPEFFWNHPHLEDIYSQVCHAVELKRRAQILNERVEVIKDALAILNNELSSTSSKRVERAILFLIAVEVCFEFTARFL